MSGDISENLDGPLNLCSPSHCILRPLCPYFPSPSPPSSPLSNTRLLVCSPLCSFSPSPHSSSLVSLGLVILLLLVLLWAVVGVKVGAVGGVGGKSIMIGVHHLPLVHSVMGDVAGAGNTVGVGEQEGTLFL